MEIPEYIGHRKQQRAERDVPMIDGFDAAGSHSFEYPAELRPSDSFSSLYVFACDNNRK